MRKIKTINLLLTALLGAGIISCTTTNPVQNLAAEPVTAARNIQSADDNPVFIVSDRGASFSMTINFSAFRIKASQNGIVARSAAHVDKYNIYLLKNSSAEFYPLNGDPIADKVPASPVFTVTNSGAPSKTVTFSKVPPSGEGLYYYVAVRAFDNSELPQDLIRVNNGRTNPGDEWTGTTAGTPYFGRVAVSIDGGVNVDSNLVVSNNTGILAISPQLLDAVGANIDSVITPVNGTAIPVPSQSPTLMSAFQITTLAGGGSDSALNDIPATSAQLLASGQVCSDAAGNIYIADKDNNRVIKVDVTGNMTTIAGTGTSGNGPDGPATDAMLDHPSGVAVEGGNLYIADTGNHKIRKVSGGNITTIAGTGSAGDGPDGPAVDAGLSSPDGLAVDGSGNLYIADTGNHKIRKISGGNISTIAGIGGGAYSGVNVPLGDGDAAANAKLSGPAGVYVDSLDNIYIADTGNNRVRKVSTGGIITTIAGTGTASFNGDGIPAYIANLSAPGGVSSDINGNIYIADAGHHRIRKVGTDGLITTIAGTGSGGFNGESPAFSPINTQLSNPGSVTFDPDGNVLISDRGNSRIRVIKKIL